MTVESLIGFGVLALIIIWILNVVKGTVKESKASNLQISPEDVDDAIKKFHAVINEKPKMYWDYTERHSMGILKIFRSIEESEIPVNQYLYQLEGDKFGMFLRYKEKDKERVKKEILD